MAAQGNPAASARSLSLPAILAFAAAYMPFAALQLSAAVQLPRFFATSLGMGATAGAIFGLVRLIDIPVDPALGLTMDRSRSRMGRYRPWLILAAPVLILAIYMTYQAEPGVSRSYLVLWLLVLYLGMSFLLVAGNAWASTLATTYKARSRIFGAQTGMGVLGAAMVLAIPIFTDSRHLSEAEGVHAIGWFLMGLAPVSILIALLRTPERIVEDNHAQRFKASDYAALLVRPNVLRLMAADFCVTLGPGWMAALYLFFFEDSRGFSVSAANILLAIYILAGLAGAPAAAWLANRISKHRALMVQTTGYSLTLIVLFLLPKGQFLPAAPAMFVAGSFAAGFVVLIRSLTADIGDEIRLEKGRNLVGLLYALTSGTTKAAAAMAAVITFAVLGAVGYNFKPGAVNGPDQIRGLELAYIIGPIVFVMIAGACFIGYRLTAERHADIRRQLDDRDAMDDPAAALESLIGDTDLAAAGRPQ
ncbi:MFS transporter [Phenylobacterium sp.]|uniref:MFS transporter n=1 Tax=Phenylobacterium sp. TaxID=1871053 RepID=UPI0025D14169|nr:MFS transporter [Phenylobacterium sp.]